jgi:Mg2+ and Co2+ transporter CorA
VKDLQKSFLAVALHFETYADRLANDTADRMLDRLGALQQLSASLDNLLRGYRDLLQLYATSNQASVEFQHVEAPAASASARGG